MQFLHKLYGKERIKPLSEINFFLSSAVANRYLTCHQLPTAALQKWGNTKTACYIPSRVVWQLTGSANDAWQSKRRKVLVLTHFKTKQRKPTIKMNHNKVIISILEHCKQHQGTWCKVQHRPFVLNRKKCAVDIL